MNENTVAEIRYLRGWTQQDLAAASGCDSTTISRIETGQQRMRPDTARRIAGALGVQVSDLEAHRSRYGIARDAADGLVAWVKRCARAGEVSEAYARELEDEVYRRYRALGGVSGWECDEFAEYMVYQIRVLADGGLPRLESTKATADE